MVNRSGLTLIEILIALTMTLVVLGAMAKAFNFASKEIANGRAILEMSNKLRNAQQLIRTDLAGVTVDIRPHTDTTPKGYFEYIDGPVNDSSAAGTIHGYLGDNDDVLAFTARNLDGNFRGRVNLVDATGAMPPLQDIIQSSFAEIVWFTEFTDLNFDGIVTDATLNVNFNDTITLYRRVLLIRPNLNDGVYLPLTTGDELPSANLAAGDPASDAALRLAIQFFINNDISARWVDTDGNGRRDTIIANSLEDLARRENRFGRDSRVGFSSGGLGLADQPSSYPHVFNRDGVSATKMGSANIDGSGVLTFQFSGDDIVLTDVAGFDVKVYSPGALVDQIDIDGNGSAETVVGASDIGFVGDPGIDATASGDFVDLGATLKANFPSRLSYDVQGGDGDVDQDDFSECQNLGDYINTDFSLLFDQFVSRPTPRSGLSYFNPGSGVDVAYCTWSPHYETDGVDQDDSNDNGGVADEGTNGFDDNGVNGVDDDSEKETSPPYPYPIRGLEIKFRIIEKNSKQIRQSTIIQNFLNR